MKWIVCTLFLMSFSFIVRSQNVTITGYVYNRETGKPIALVNVSTVGNNHLKDDLTDSEGLFLISLKGGIKAGDLIRIRATKEGFEARDERIVVSSLKPVNIEMSQNKASVSAGKKIPVESGIAYYRKNLKDKDSSVRQEACKSLGYMGEKSKAAVPDLVSTLLYDGSSYVKISAAEALKAISPTSKEVVESFIATLKNSNPMVREAAAKGLEGAPSGSKNAVKALISALHDKALKVRVYSMLSLMSLDESLYGLIMELLQFSLVNRDEEIRTVAFNTVMGLDSLPADILTLLVKNFYREFSLTGEKKDNDYTTDSEIPGISWDIFERSIKALVYFENKGQSIIDRIINYSKSKKEPDKYFAEVWLKEDTSKKGIEFVVSLLTNENIDTTVMSVLAKSGPGIIPILKNQLQLNPVNKIWIFKPLIVLEPASKAELQEFIVKASGLEASPKDEFHFWWRVTNFLKEYNLFSPELFSVFAKMLVKDTKGTNWAWQSLVKGPSLQVLLDNLDTHNDVVQPLLIKMVDNCKNDFYCKLLEAIININAEAKNKAIIDALWDRKIKSQFVCAVQDVFKLRAIRVNMGLFSLADLTNWFNELPPDVQLTLLTHMFDYSRQYDPKTAVPVLIEALSKGNVHQLTAARSLERIGPAAIQSVPFLEKAQQATSDSRIKATIEKAIEAIENK